MNRVVTMLATVAALAAAMPARAAGWRAIERVPGGTRVDVLVNARHRVYFRVTSQSPLVVPIEGPARVRVVTRIEMPRGERGVATYRVRAMEGATTLGQLATETSAAPGARLANGGTSLGKSRRMGFDLPAGRHRVALGLTGAAVAFVRIQTSSTRGAAPTVALTPVAAPRSVMVSEGERLVPYYSVLPGRPVRLRVVGPTTLQILTRLDFDETMRGAQTYRIRLTEAGQVLRDSTLRTTRAATAAYTNLARLVPSRNGRLSVPIGDGTHEVAVELIEPARGSAEIHARIPEPAVGNEE